MLAKVASLVQNIALAVYAKEGEEPKFTAPIDFIPIWDPEEVKRLEKEKVQKQTVEELKAGLLSFAKVHNLRIEKALNRKRNPPPKFRKHGS